ncbi:hypothetical protein C0Q70_12890 [Pomacea canaliculata]|uniref:Uncharacterized protein n=1 Tax=Pomacea canaliculata TaxID=400727 RepID=A0A2T7P2R7_POMCA|nr:hypothetical protein C0Q70_12890 [Pomacea canaliculata]
MRPLPRYGPSRSQPPRFSQSEEERAARSCQTCARGAWRAVTCLAEGKTGEQKARWSERSEESQSASCVCVKSERGYEADVAVSEDTGISEMAYGGWIGRVAEN